MFAIIKFYDHNATYIDLSVILAYLLSYDQIISKMRLKSLILSGLVIPAMLSPWMAQLWLIHGSGNANFLFFQGLLMWLFAALGIIEFIIAIREIMIETNNKSKEKIE